MYIHVILSTELCFAVLISCIVDTHEFNESVLKAKYCELQSSLLSSFFRSMFIISLGVLFSNLVQFCLPTAGKRARRL